MVGKPAEGFQSQDGGHMFPLWKFDLYVFEGILKNVALENPGVAHIAREIIKYGEIALQIMCCGTIDDCVLAIFCTAWEMSLVWYAVSH